MVSSIEAFQYYSAVERRKQLSQALVIIQKLIDDFNRGYPFPFAELGTDSVYKTLQSMITTEDFDQPLLVKNCDGVIYNLTSRKQLNKEMTISFLCKGIVRANDCGVFPIYSSDLEYDKLLIQNRIDEYDIVISKFNLLLPKFDDDKLPLVKLLYQCISTKRLYFGKRAQDNICSEYTPLHPPESTPSPEIDEIEEWSIAAEHTKILGNGVFGIAFAVFDTIRCKPYVVKICKDITLNQFGYSCTNNNPHELLIGEMDIVECLRRQGDNLSINLPSQYGFCFITHDIDGIQLKNNFLLLISEFIPPHPKITKWLTIIEASYHPEALRKQSLIVPPIFTIPQIIHITIQLTIACHKLHQLHIIHRDIKHTNFLCVDIASIPNPYNLPLPSIMIIKLIDYGLSSIALPVKTSNGIELLADSNGGTAMFKCPSLGHGAYNGRWTDLHACGIVALQLLFGYSPGILRLVLDGIDVALAQGVALAQVRSRLTFDDYIDEYQLFRQRHPIITKLLQKDKKLLTDVEKTLVEDRSEILIKQYPDFLDALKTLFSQNQHMKDRELWFQSKCFIDNIDFIQNELQIYKNLIKSTVVNVDDKDKETRV